jgi:hypothetical protein
MYRSCKIIIEFFNLILKFELWNDISPIYILQIERQRKNSRNKIEKKKLKTLASLAESTKALAPTNAKER